MILAFYILIFIFGTLIGSFLNCVIYRTELQETGDKSKSFLQGRSFCPKCKHNLDWRDLMPVFSFVALRGRCRYCKDKISIQYPLVEVGTGLLLILNFKFLILNQILILNFKTLVDVIFLLVVIFLLELIFIYDLKHYIIPDKFVFPAIGLAIVYQAVGNLPQFISTLLAAFSATGFFFLIWAVSKGKWLGFGDVKLAFLLGLLLGWPNVLVGLFLAFMLGSIVGLALIGFGKKTLKSQVPFGPFLIVGAMIGLLWGQGIIRWYLGLIT